MRNFDINEDPHRRYNPLINEWVLVSPHRAKRPWQGQKEAVANDDRPEYDPECYLCPGNTRANGVTNENYTTNGEYAIVIKGVEKCVLRLNSNTTDHVVIKSLTKVIVISNELIDEEFNEVELNKGSCVEFKFIGDFWYILSSDGLKNS